MSLETLRPLLAGAPEMRGVIDVTADLSGTASAPLLEGKASITALSIAGQSFEGMTATLAYHPGTAVLRAELRQDSSHTLSAEGTLPVTARWDPSWRASPAGDATLALRSSGVSLAPLNAFAGRNVEKIQGELAGEVTASGPFDALKPRGSLELRGGEVSIKTLGTAFSEGTVQLRFDPEAIRVDKIFARSGDGTLEGSGTIPLVAGAPDPLRFSVEARKLRAAGSHRYRGDVDASLSVQGTTAAPEVLGRIEVLWAMLRPDLAFLGKKPSERDPTIQIASDEVLPEPAAAAVPPAPRPRIYEASTLDVTLAIHRNTWVRQEDTAVELEGEVRATKKPNAEIELVGEVRTVRGWGLLQGRRFTVSRGRVLFTGGPLIDPTLDIVADYRSKGYLVHAIVSGTANSPALTLESEPSLEQADIVSVLIFGKPSSELNDGQKSDLRKEASNLAAGFAFTEIGKSVTQALGLERHGIHVEELSSERLAVGSNVTKDTYVSVAQNLGDRKGEEVSLQHEIVRDWSVQGTTNTNGGSGLDVIWHRRY